MNLSDKTIAEFALGSAHAYQAVFDVFRMRVFYYIKRLVDDQLAAEEITSDTFVKLYRQHKLFSDIDHIQAFLYLTARNASLDYLKAAKRHRQLLLEYQQQEAARPDSPGFADENIEADVLQYLMNEIEKLPKRSKQIFKLFYFEGLSIQEIAEKMNINKQTVANQKTAFLKVLRIKAFDRPFLLFLLVTLIRNCCLVIKN